MVKEEDVGIWGQGVIEVVTGLEWGGVLLA